MIYLTEPKNLEAGLWWAREITGEKTRSLGPWLIVQLTGVSPFFSLSIEFVSGSEDWRYPSDKRYPETVNPNSWEFGPRIDIPGDKERVEYAPKQMKRQED